jgi:predicted DNA-binding transcriptional regulator AlpA
MITGWKEIIDHTGYSRSTLIQLMKKESFPIQIIARKPTTTDQAIQEWFKKRLKQSKPTSN